MKLELGGALRRSLAASLALASISFSIAVAGECAPDLANHTPTPTLAWTIADLTNTAGFRVYWKHADDVAWRGSMDLPVWPGDENSDPVYPGITEDFPLQRLVPRVAQRILIDVRVVSYDAANVEGPPSTILRVCMPEIWTDGSYR